MADPMNPEVLGDRHSWREEDGRLHGDGGPAVELADGGWEWRVKDSPTEQRLRAAEQTAQSMARCPGGWTMESGVVCAVRHHRLAPSEAATLRSRLLDRESVRLVRPEDYDQRRSTSAS